MCLSVECCWATVILSIKWWHCCYLYCVVCKSGWTLLRENAIYHLWHQVKYVLIACLVWMRKYENLYVMYVAIDWYGKNFTINVYIYNPFLEYTYCSSWHGLITLQAIIDWNAFLVLRSFFCIFAIFSFANE